MLDATPDSTYYIMVAALDWTGPAGTFHLSVFGPPANDDMQNATIVPSLPFTDTIDTTAATTASDDPDCG